MGAYCIGITQGWSLTLALTLKEFNNATADSIDVFPVTVFSIIAQSFVIHLLLWMRLCGCKFV